VFALWQVGLSGSAIRNRAARGKLRRVHTGVYSVGLGKLTTAGHFMAAVLACGPRAVLSHRSAAEQLGLRFSARAKIEVTVPRGAARSRRGIEVHYGEVEPVVIDAVPCTTVARTIVDCAEVLPPYSIENMLDRAEQLRVFDLRAIEAQLDGRRGAKKLRSLLGIYRPDPGTKNDFEKLLLRVCREAGIRAPDDVNVTIEGEERDFVWLAERVIVESDGRETHDTTRQFEEDRRRDQELSPEWRVVRVTWRQLTQEPERVARAIARRLRRPPS
jgi:very-short-patch-repair endonuclease